VAERVSVVIRAPFSRIDLYDIRGRIVFGEVTPCPGSSGGFGPDLDVMMGEAWERAQVRLWRDIAEGVSREAEWGPLGAPAWSTSATDMRPRELLIGRAVESTEGSRDQAVVNAVEDFQLA
jgi:TupA-like ATPgrasp